MTRGNPSLSSLNGACNSKFSELPCQATCEHGQDPFHLQASSHWVVARKLIKGTLLADGLARLRHLDLLDARVARAAISTDKLPYVTMGSGSLAAMSVFETQWKPNLTKDDAIKLTSDAILAGIFNDLGSGSNVDVAVITQEKTTLLRNFIKPNEKSAKLQSYVFPKGTTNVLNERIIKKNEIGRYITVQDVPLEGDQMEVDT
ncbi:hypothetical protein NLG97_g5198 [Lecanicillium saksenae]|uniref:Uncharacterized protein n=1 Tax=Lecanicillium saksenae TaxID=468837 RepID=A0ACC1QTP4_9HYPO|nr:hypothetical protein NLG97_g5198 [Lecanicillium saksenae]